MFASSRATGLKVLSNERQLTPVKLKGEDVRGMLSFLKNSLLHDGGMTADERAAVQLRIIGLQELQKEDFSAQQIQYQRDFEDWLMGKGKEEDHAITPWYRTPLQSLPGVSEYVSKNVQQKYELLKKLAHIKITQAKDIQSAEAYFRYIIRSKENGIDDLLDRYSTIEKEEQDRLLLGDELVDKISSAVLHKTGAMVPADWEPLEDYFSQWTEYEGTLRPADREKMRAKLLRRQDVINKLSLYPKHDAVKQIMEDYFSNKNSAEVNQSARKAIDALSKKSANLSRMLQQLEEAGELNDVTRKLLEDRIKEANDGLEWHRQKVGAADPEEYVPQEVKDAMERGEELSEDFLKRKLNNSWYQMMRATHTLINIVHAYFAKDIPAVALEESHQVLAYFQRVVARLVSLIGGYETGLEEFEDAMGDPLALTPPLPEEPVALTSLLQALEDLCSVIENLEAQEILVLVPIHLINLLIRYLEESNNILISNTPTDSNTMSQQPPDADMPDAISSEAPPKAQSTLQKTEALATQGQQLIKRLTQDIIPMLQKAGAQKEAMRTHTQDMFDLKTKHSEALNDHNITKSELEELRAKHADADASQKDLENQIGNLQLQLENKEKEIKELNENATMAEEQTEHIATLTSELEEERVKVKSAEALLESSENRDQNHLADIAKLSSEKETLLSEKADLNKKYTDEVQEANDKATEAQQKIQEANDKATEAQQKIQEANDKATEAQQKIQEADERRRQAEKELEEVRKESLTLAQAQQQKINALKKEIEVKQTALEDAMSNNPPGMVDARKKKRFNDLSTEEAWELQNQNKQARLNNPPPKLDPHKGVNISDLQKNDIISFNGLNKK